MKQDNSPQDKKPTIWAPGTIQKGTIQDLVSGKLPPIVCVETEHKVYAANDLFTAIHLYEAQRIDIRETIIRVLKGYDLETRR